MRHLEISTFLLLLFVHVSAIASELLDGVVADTDRQPIELASVRILSADHEFIDGVITDSCGRFAAPMRPDARYIHVSALGYEDATCGIASLPDTICLKSAAYKLSEITVESTRKTVTLRGSSLLVDVQHSPLGDMPTTEDVLKLLPSVNGDDGKYSVFGRGEAAIYINNRKVTDSGELSRLRPSEISKIEIIRNPGADYDSDTPAVIRIYLKQSALDGFGLEAMIYGSQGRRFSDYEQISMTYGINKVNLFLTLANSSSRLRSDQTNLQDTYTTAGLWEMGSDMPRWDSEYYNLAVNGGFNVMFNKKHEAGAKMTYSDDTQRNGGQKASLMTLNGQTYEHLTSTSRNPQGYTQYSTNIYYDGRLSDRTELIFNSDYLHRTSHSSTSITEQGNLTEQHTVENVNRSVYDLWSADIKLRWSVSDRFKLTMGGDGNLVKQKRTGIQTENSTETGLDSKDSKYGIFCQGSYDIARYNISLGMRYEGNHMLYTDAVTGMTMLRKNYSRIYPSASVSATFGAAEMTLAFTSKVRRPTFYQLRNSSEYFNRYETTEGNPLLLPTYTYDLSYSIGYSNLTANIGYRWIKDYIAEKNIIDTDNPLHMTSRPFNKPHYTALDMGINYNRVFGCYHPYISAELSKTFYTIDNSTNSVTTIGNTPSIRFSLTNYFTIGGYTLYLDLKYSPAGYYCQYREEDYIGIDCGAYKRFLENTLYLSLQANNILGSTSRSTTIYDNSTFDRKSFRDTRRIALVISYSFRHDNKYRGKTSAKDEILRMD